MARAYVYLLRWHWFAAAAPYVPRVVHLLPDRPRLPGLGPAFPGRVGVPEDDDSFHGGQRPFERLRGFFLFAIVASFIDQAMGTHAGQPGIATIVLVLAAFLPNLAVTVRRLHDTGRSGWWIFLGMIPLIGSIVLIVFYASDSQRGANQYGKSPKELEAPQYV